MKIYQLNLYIWLPVPSSEPNVHLSAVIDEAARLLPRSVPGKLHVKWISKSNIVQDVRGTYPGNFKNTDRVMLKGKRSEDIMVKHKLIGKPESFRGNDNVELRDVITTYHAAYIYTGEDLETREINNEARWIRYHNEDHIKTS